MMVPQFMSNMQTQIAGSITFRMELKSKMQGDIIAADQVEYVDGFEYLYYEKPLSFFEKVLSEVDIVESEKDKLKASNILSIVFGFTPSENRRAFVFSNESLEDGENIFIHLDVRD